LIDYFSYFPLRGETDNESKGIVYSSLFILFELQLQTRNELQCNSSVSQQTATPLKLLTVLIRNVVILLISKHPDYD
jgi:hypothetical protein